MSDYPQVVYRKHTFLSALAMGLSAVVIAFIISCTVVIIYGMNFAGDKSDKIISLLEDAVRGLPKLQESLPPALADFLNDRRQPDYCTQLEITAKTTPSTDPNGSVQTTVKVVNNGQDVVSLLSLRVVILNTRDEILAESNEWAATPIAAEDKWRGPLMPGSRRYFLVSQSDPFPVSTRDYIRTEVEITDIRVWSSEKEIPVIDNQVSSGTEKPDSQPVESVENK